MVIRHVIARIPTLEELGLPPVLQRLAFLKGGLVLTVGSAGSGKTTTLAALLDHRNTHTGGHILTVEDPIEYLHSHKKSLVTQREVGLDTLSYDEALRRAMREAPKATLNKSLAHRAPLLWAVCSVANPRDSYGYRCGLRLASHPKSGRAPLRGLIQRCPT